MSRTLADEARKLNSRNRFKPRRKIPFLFLMTDPRAGNPVAAAERLPKGSGVILRHYGDPDREALGKRLAKVCEARGLVFLVAGDWQLAERLGADGVHLPEGAASHDIPAPCRGWRRGRILTVAAHGRQGLIRAEQLKVDAVLLSPVFPTGSHPDAEGLGPERFSALVKVVQIPVVALGGITTSTVRQLNQSGAWGVAAVSALMPQ